MNRANHWIAKNILAGLTIFLLVASLFSVIPFSQAVAQSDESSVATDDTQSILPPDQTETDPPKDESVTNPSVVEEETVADTTTTTTFTNPCPDFDNDNVVTQDDVDFVKAHSGTAGGFDVGDANGDGSVNSGDISYTKSQLGRTCKITVTIIKYIDGSKATPESADNASFNMTATWNAENIGAGSGSFDLDADGFNGDSTPYQAITSEMTSGADYSVVENNVPSSCSDTSGYSLDGYKVGDSESDALASSTQNSANLSDIANNMYILVMNHNCASTEILPCPDFDHDHIVTDADVDFARAHALTVGGGFDVGDVTGDGRVDSADVTYTRSQLGRVCQVISGMKWNDVNGDGQINNEETGLPGWTITLLNSDGNEITSTTTDSSGNYSFNDLDLGTYYVCESPQDGWQQTYPTDNYGCENGTEGYSLSIESASDNNGNINFGNQVIPCELNQTSTDVVSDESTQVDGHDSVAVTPHPAWTSIPDATWIWAEALDQNGSSPAETKEFTKAFNISGTPLNSVLKIAADNYYSLMVNGNPFDTGTSATDLDNFSSADTWNIPAASLQSGNNTFSFTVTNPGTNPDNGQPFGDPNPAGLDYKLTVNSNGCNPPEPTFVKVHIYKYVGDSEESSQVPDDSADTPFPMNATWHATNLDGGATSSADYVLGNHHGGATSTFAADTSPMQTPVIFYHTYEKTTADDQSSQVVPTNSEVCPAGDFRLLGYRSGNSLAEAENAELTTDSPNYEGFSQDKFLIVVNQPCPPDEGGEGDQATLTIVKNTQSGNGTFTFNLSGDTSTSTNVTTTAGTGTVTLNLNDGTTTISEISQNGWTLASSSCQYDNESIGISVPNGETVVVDDGDHVTCTFTNTKSTGWINGLKFNDQNSNSIRDEGEPGLPDWGINLSRVVTNEDESTSTELVATTTTDSSGNWSFPPQSWGTYIITETQQSGWTQTAPTSTSFTISITPCFSIFSIDFVGFCGDINTDINGNPLYFGNHQNPTDNNNGGGGGGGGGSVTTSVIGGFGGPSGGNIGQVLGTSTGPMADQGGPLTCSAYLLKYMRYGRSNDPVEVKKLQAFLNEFQNAGLPVTGFFGKLTLAAVKIFQVAQEAFIRNPWGQAGVPISNSEWPTGYVYKTTLHRINELKCASLNAPIPQLP